MNRIIRIGSIFTLIMAGTAFTGRENLRSDGSDTSIKAIGGHVTDSLQDEGGDSTHGLQDVGHETDGLVAKEGADIITRIGNEGAHGLKGDNDSGSGLVSEVSNGLLVNCKANQILAGIEGGHATGKKDVEPLRWPYPSRL